jgi:hypothetical protein
MGLRLVLLSGLVSAVAIAAAVVLLAGGGGRVDSPAELATPSSNNPAAIHPSSMAPAHVATAIPEPAQTAPYADAPAALRELAVRFVGEALGYDATTEARDEFLDRIRPLTAPAELLRLRRSQRAHLDWGILRARGETVAVHVTGTTTTTTPTELASPSAPSSAAASAPASPVVIVEAVRTTTTDLATVRDFVEITLRLEQHGPGWRVASAHGGGL